MRLLFTTTPSLLSIGIRAFEGGRASHVGVQLDNLVIDATFKHGVRCINVVDWTAEQGRPMVDVVPLSLPDPDAAWAFLNAQIGKPYDVSAWFGWLMWRDWSDDRAWYCSELALAAALAGGRTIADRRPRIGVRLLREISTAWGTAK